MCRYILWNHIRYSFIVFLIFCELFVDLVSNNEKSSLSNKNHLESRSNCFLTGNIQLYIEIAFRLDPKGVD
jgi:hypothetical protein